ncbi:aldose 1-epimerase family protein [Pontibacter sp. G13]|uniref:aldose 1-epimerase family protein n=1 Tax=Pontibacter sp. G13 TaxID=3074898 RepID=UPI0028895390|nr:aldose 1-epimerase family protein [Pontibacter sp. G13]WNJ18212.1 aldose 1-epimerase family protein [Pontibacter sp. G13]
MSHISIKNDTFSAAIDPTGAQLASLVRLSTGEEFMWQRDPAFWKDVAPVLFPIVGGLRNGTYSYDGKTYEMAKHGVVRHVEFELAQHTDDACELVFKANEVTQASFPFDFELRLIFQLTETGIQVNYHILNAGAVDMPAGLGYHPAFNINIEDFSHSDYEIFFDHPETLDLYGLVDGLTQKKQDEYLKDTQILPVTEHLFDEDALIFLNISSKSIGIRRKSDDWSLTMTTGGAPHLGIWAKPAAPYICLEPWYTYNDSPAATGDLFQKEGMKTMKPGEVFEAGYTVSV